MKTIATGLRIENFATGVEISKEDAKKLQEQVACLNNAICQLYAFHEGAGKIIRSYPPLQEGWIEENVYALQYFIYFALSEFSGLSLQNIHEMAQASQNTILGQVDAQRKNHLHTMPYTAYLLTEHWQQKRREAHERANGRCQVCNATTSLNVHHRTYVRRGYELPEDLIVLCKGCHQLFHDNGKLEAER